MLFRSSSSRTTTGVRWTSSGLGLAATGALVIAVSPFAGGTPIMANYVPVIESPAFLLGLALFAAGIVLVVGRGLFASPLVGMRLDGAGALRFGLNGAVVAAAVAAFAFAWSFAVVPAGLDGKAYYELLFWGGGHVLQLAGGSFRAPGVLSAAAWAPSACEACTTRPSRTAMCRSEGTAPAG